MLETLIAVLSYSSDLNYPAEVSFASWMKKGCASRTLPTSVGIKKGFTSEELSTMNGLASSHCWLARAMRGMAHRRAWSGPPERTGSCRTWRRLESQQSWDVVPNRLFILVDTLGRAGLPAVRVRLAGAESVPVARPLRAAL